MLSTRKLFRSFTVFFALVGVLMVTIGAIVFLNQPIASANNPVRSISQSSQAVNLHNLAQAPSLMAIKATVYRDPNCSCCEAWMEHLRSSGFQISEVQQPDMDAVKQEYSVPSQLQSCHTAIINGAVIEGHVPVEDIKRFLAEESGAAGLAVPGMPIGSPGMEDGETQEPFTVYSFDQQGNAEAFNQYSS
ncbi:DUF411 domain-containing protein [Leptolyngbya ohadii]|uniref:DUF411 domain-containing protein n=1 Tax=Leptolyngbya ohadii TaxID=1962290 RepID=UPI0019D43D09|nr:DUF411 domain-containing protein [Leptolyngbya ohadii]